jgi:hypothetical protein
MQCFKLSPVHLRELNETFLMPVCRLSDLKGESEFVSGGSQQQLRDIEFR